MKDSEQKFSIAVIGKVLSASADGTQDGWDDGVERSGRVECC